MANKLLKKMRKAGKQFYGMMRETASYGDD